MIINIKLEPNYDTKTVIVPPAWFWRALNTNISHSQPFYAMKSCDKQNISVLSAEQRTKIFQC